MNKREEEKRLNLSRQMDIRVILSVRYSNRLLMKPFMVWVNISRTNLITKGKTKYSINTIQKYQSRLLYPIKTTEFYGTIIHSPGLAIHDLMPTLTSSTYSTKTEIRVDLPPHI